MKSIKKVTADGELDVVIELSEVDYQYPLLFAGKTGMVVNPAVFEEDADSLATQPRARVRSSDVVRPERPREPEEEPALPGGRRDRDRAGRGSIPSRTGDRRRRRAVGAVQPRPPGRHPVQQAKDAGLDVQVIDTMFVSVLDVHAGMAPFDDPAVVEAMKYAIDREKLKEVASFGVGDVNYQPFPPGYVGYNEDLADAYAYDPDKARAILSDRQLPTRSRRVFTSSGQAPAAVELIQAQLKEVGIDATIETIPQTHHTQQVYLEHSKALTYDGFAGRESPVQAFQVLFGAEGLMNPGRQTNSSWRSSWTRSSGPRPTRPSTPPCSRRRPGSRSPAPNTFLQAGADRACPQRRLEAARPAEPAPVRG